MEWNDLMKDSTWKDKLGEYLNKNFENIVYEIAKTKLFNKSNMMPKKEDLFNAFNYCDVYNTKVVIVCRSLYTDIIDGKTINDGLLFSQNNGDPQHILNCIFEELKNSVYKNKELPEDFYNTDLKKWSLQGVLLLNLSFTGLENNIRAHDKLWSGFIKEVFKILHLKNNVVYILLGKEAQECKKYIGNHNHILESGHPNMFKGNESFKNSNVFLKCNKILTELYEKTINW